MNTYEWVVALIREDIKWHDLSVEDRRLIKGAIQSWYESPTLSLITFVHRFNTKRNIQLPCVCSKNYDDKTFLLINQQCIDDDYLTLKLMDNTVHKIVENMTYQVPSSNIQIKLVVYS